MVFPKYKRKEIALLLPNTNPILSAIADGVVGALTDTNLDIRLTQLSAKENYEDFAFELDEFLDTSKIDLIYSVGNRCTRAIKNKTEEKNKLVPIVFGAVHDPVGYGLVKDEKYSGNHLSGMMVDKNSTFNAEFAFHVSLIPNVKNVLILADTVFIESRERAVDVSNHLGERNVSARIVSISVGTRLTEMLTPLLDSVDAIVLMRETHLIQHFDELALLAQRFKRPAFSADIETVIRGIPFGYGLDERKIGEQTALVGTSILESIPKIDHGCIQRQNVECQLFINEDMFNGLYLEKNFLEMIPSSKFTFV